MRIGTVPTAAQGEKEPARIRQFFPETLYTNPSLITDEQGKAALNLEMADSITTWRLTAMASTKDGKLGANTNAPPCPTPTGNVYVRMSTVCRHRFKIGAFFRIFLAFLFLF